MELTPFLFGLYKLVKYLLYPLTWVLLVMTMTTVLLCLPPSHRRLRWARIWAVSALLLLVAISTPLVARPLLGTLEAWYPRPSLSSQEQYHAVVVLGGGVLQRGPSARCRISLLSLRTGQRAAWTCSNKGTPTSSSSLAAVAMCSRKGRGTLSK